jgi:hypothetical protein
MAWRATPATVRLVPAVEEGFDSTPFGLLSGAIALEESEQVLQGRIINSARLVLYSRLPKWSRGQWSFQPIA